MLRNFWKDESGFLVSTELVFIATLCVIGLVTGLSQVAGAVIGELSDVGCAVGSLNQSFFTSGWKGATVGSCVKGLTLGSKFEDHVDTCDCDSVTLTCTAAPECTTIP
jgi:Flp pilus assembly pilin Flp